MYTGEHGGLRRSRSVLGRFPVPVPGGVAGRGGRAGCGCEHTDVHAATIETCGNLEDSGGCLVAPGRAGAAPDP
ncbi:hypothetical protein NDU88_007315 [Pleurodeles waltl]|uniref:Uncharacterized protein n=1 Tax=Pleurodeles waltl TaxID=8319 RepID=A0AAV7SSE0_PLEWA|nr:hypothetical protein NDU88_007315 [Pleurodeles waltl]